MGAPIGNTCSDIDQYISKVDKIKEGLQALSADITTHTIDDIVSMLDGFADEVNELEADFEDCRDSNSKLREWGTEKEEEVDMLESELSDKDSEIEELQEEISNMEVA